MISSKIGHRLDPAILFLYRSIFGQKVISPNVISCAGALFGFLAAALIFMEYPATAAACLLTAGFFDILDGAIARGSGRVTRFGGFFDSVLDRYTDMSVMGAILFVYVRHGSMEYAMATLVAAIGTALIPYARARAEAASLSGKTGLLERPERLVLLIVGLFIPFLLGCIIIALAVLTHVTVAQRILHVWKQTK
ncbi:MAG: CDP-alcohol phosphatidyltransferase family protein [Syntrophorhabdaceae bacterium]|nr:CDP-alcohol phosphatidyltransferase family protein [Syntrophorhabdaceae bacterium]